MMHVVIICLVFSLFQQTLSTVYSTGTVEFKYNISCSISINDTASDDSQVTITLSGPDTRWVGIGFDATKMSDEPYAIIVNGNNAALEQSLVHHDYGTTLTNTLTSIVSTIIDDMRTTVITRAINGLTSDYYTFPTTEQTINIIWGIGNDDTYAKHWHDGISTITLTTEDDINATVFQTTDNDEYDTTYHDHDDDTTLNPNITSVYNTYSGYIVLDASYSLSLNLLYDTIDSMVTITMTGSNGVWFGIGFVNPSDEAKMLDTYAIIVDGEGSVYEYKLGDHKQGTKLNSTVEVLSSTDISGIREVVLQRSFIGMNDNYYSFDIDTSNSETYQFEIQLIWAINVDTVIYDGSSKHTTDGHGDDDIITIYIEAASTTEINETVSTTEIYETVSTTDNSPMKFNQFLYLQPLMIFIWFIILALE